MTTRKHLARALVTACAVAALATGCGIRETKVPVDAGAAPSRVPCSMPAENVSTQALQGFPVRIYLLCRSQLVPVERTVRPADQPGRAAGPSGVAQSLLDQLGNEPTPDEKTVGYSTGVGAALTVTGPRSGDPAGALRLSVQPEDLPSRALAQIVCTFAESDALGTDGAVALGGPGKYPVRTYLCTQETKNRPGSVPTGAAVTAP
ncbi:hypothetical protein [Streptomyces sp. NPDC050504]|uniref:hypothetical protein n=1 Tax=Streptomyces sp. NPDC050504 TaxID=3365618 RepID=UPI00378B4207